MSLIIYRKGAVYVDASGVITVKKPGSGHDMVPCSIEKFYMAKDRKIAVVYTGNQIDQSSKTWKDQVKLFRRVLSKMGGGDPAVCKEIALHADYQEHGMYVLTSKAFYRLDGESGPEVPGYDFVKRTMTPIDSLDWDFHGSARDVASFIVSAGITTDVMEIFSIVSSNVELLYRTQVTCVDQKTLKPFN